MTEPVPTGLFDEQSALKALQRDAHALAKQLEALAKLKPGDAEALDGLEKALAVLPSGEQLGHAIDELRARAEAALAAARAARTEAFRRHEAEFIRELRAAGTPVREAGNSAWRVGPLEFELQRERSRARVLYNRDPVTRWKAIGSRDDLDELVAGAKKSLEAAALASEVLPEVLWDAYEHLQRTSARAGGGAVRVPLIDFFREVRVSLARHELRGGKPDRKLSRTELPRWAFLYNLDLYRRMLPELPPERRLSFETGSQHDHQKGLAMVVNGLDANADYKSYCYVYAAPVSQQ